MKILLNKIIYVALLLIVVSCGGGTKGIGDYSTAANFGLNGAVQKGPFVSGTTVFIQELDSSLQSTGTSYQTTTDDDFGSFTLGNNIKSRYIEVMATGYYYDEVAGALSASTLTLRAVADLNDGTDVNINLLTTLEIDRIKQLITSEGKSYSVAKTQAEGEILTLFNIPTTGVGGFEKMDISEAGTSNGILLAVSSILQADNTVAQLSELISKINLDIKTDGDVDTAATTAEIVANSQYINTATITTNLQARYTALGLDSVTVPSFSGHVDSDGDGVLNSDDDDTLTSTAIADVDALWSFYFQDIETLPLTVAGLLTGGSTDLSVDSESVLFKNSVNVGTSTQIVNGDEIIIKRLDVLGFSNATGFGGTLTSTVTFGNPSSDTSSSTITYTATKPTVAQSTAVMNAGSDVSVAGGVYYALPFIASSSYTARYVLTPNRNITTDKPVEVCIYTDNLDEPDTNLGCTTRVDNIIDNPEASFTITAGGTYTSSATTTQLAYMGDGVALTNATKYWVVMKLGYSTSFEAIDSDAAGTAFSTRLKSDDAATWTIWASTNEATGTKIYPMAILE